MYSTNVAYMDFSEGYSISLANSRNKPTCVSNHGEATIYDKKSFAAHSMWRLAFTQRKKCGKKYVN